MVDHFLSTSPAAEGPAGHAKLDEPGTTKVCKLRTVGIPTTCVLVSIVIVLSVSISVSGINIVSMQYQNLSRYNTQLMYDITHLIWDALEEAKNSQRIQDLLRSDTTRSHTHRRSCSH